MLAAWLKKHYVLLWWSLFLLFALPAVSLLWMYLGHSLGIHPLRTLQHTTGKWALILLLLSLVITPLRRGLARLSMYLHSGHGKRLSDWNWIIRLRRMIGLYAFFYACLHLFVFMHFDIGWDWLATLEETEEKPYILAGVSAFLLLLPVAFSSTNGMMRRLGKNWRRLHRLVYLVTILALLHYWWQMRLGVYSPWPYTALAVYLLGYRLIVHLGWFAEPPSDDGMEVAERGRHHGGGERRIELQTMADLDSTMG